MQSSFRDNENLTFVLSRSQQNIIKGWFAISIVAHLVLLFGIGLRSSA